SNLAQPRILRDAPRRRHSSGLVAPENEISLERPERLARVFQYTSFPCSYLVHARHPLVHGTASTPKRLRVPKLGTSISWMGRSLVAREAFRAPWSEGPSPKQAM